MASRLTVKNFVATIITIAVCIVAAAFIALLLDVRAPILSDITDTLGLSSPE